MRCFRFTAMPALGQRYSNFWAVLQVISREFGFQYDCDLGFYS